MKITDFVTKDSMAHFVHYREGHMIYEVNNFQFPVPLSDVGTGTLLRDDKSIYFMRWIRQHLESIKCCERDHNLDGNCDIHSLPGINRSEFNPS